MKLTKIIAIDFIGVGLLAAAISFFGCKNDPATSEESPVATTERHFEVKTPVTAPAPPSVATPVDIQEPVKEVTYADAEAAYNERDYVAATDLFSRYTENKPDNPWGYYMLGLSARKSGDLETAEQAFKTALELDPRHVKSMLNLSRVYLDSDRANEALEQLYAVFEVDPQSGTSYRLHGRALYQLGDTTDAVLAYQDAVVNDGEDAWAINNLGLIYLEQGKFEEAQQALARATMLNERVAAFQNNLGMAMEQTHHFRAAQEAYEAAIAIDPTIPTATANLARIEKVEEDTATESVDLDSLANAFVAQRENWVAEAQRGRSGRTTAAAAVEAGTTGDPLGTPTRAKADEIAATEDAVGD